MLRHPVGITVHSDRTEPMYQLSWNFDPRNPNLYSHIFHTAKTRPVGNFTWFVIVTCKTCCVRKGLPLSYLSLEFSVPTRAQSANSTEHSLSLRQECEWESEKQNQLSYHAKHTGSWRLKMSRITILWVVPCFNVNCEVLFQWYTVMLLKMCNILRVEYHLAGDTCSSLR